MSGDFGGEPWQPATATRNINAIAGAKGLHLVPRVQAMEEMERKGLVMADVLTVLRNGFVHEAPVAASTPAASNHTFWKYQIEGRTPNSESRDVRLIVIPDAQRTMIKILTVMWVDERMTTNAHVETWRTRDA